MTKAEAKRKAQVRKAVLLEAAQLVQRGEYGACIAITRAADTALTLTYKEVNSLVDQFTKHFKPSAKEFRESGVPTTRAYWGDAWGKPMSVIRWHALAHPTKEANQCRILALLFFMHMQEAE